jgi:carboxymethylenebutenolidase
METDKLKTLLQEYKEGRISRRDFIHRAIVWTGSVAAATNFVDSLLCTAAHGAQTDPNDPALTSTEVKYSSTDGSPIAAYLTRPKEEGRRPAVIVVHDNGALEAHNRDVGRRLAKAGYVTLVPDLLSRHGGTDAFPDRDATAKAISKLDDDTIIKDLTGAVNYLKAQSFVQPNKIGVIGFCWGGGRALLFTTRSKELAASVIYYGDSPRNLDDVKNITAPVLGHYGETDERITSGVPKLEEAMKKYGKSFEYKIYPGAGHAFNSDNRSDRYRPEAANEAWSRTLDFFKKHLQG